MSFAQMEGRCFCFWRKGHYSNQCRKGNKPKEDWTINKEKGKNKNNQQSYLQNENNSTVSREDDKRTKSASFLEDASKTNMRWQNMHLIQQQFIQAHDMKKSILIDNQS